jgi:hypothetical protein
MSISNTIEFEGILETVSASIHSCAGGSVVSSIPTIS